MSTVECPSCGCKLRATEALRGAQVQCPRCGTTFTGPAPEALPVETPAEEPVGAETESLGPPIRGLPPPPTPFKPVLLSSSTEADSPDLFPQAPRESWRSCAICGNRELAEVPRCTVCGSEMGRAPRPEPHLPARRDYEPDR